MRLRSTERCTWASITQVRNDKSFDYNKYSWVAQWDSKTCLHQGKKLMSGLDNQEDATILHRCWSWSPRGWWWWCKDKADDGYKKDTKMIIIRGCSRKLLRLYFQTIGGDEPAVELSESEEHRHQVPVFLFVFLSFFLFNHHQDHFQCFSTQIHISFQTLLCVLKLPKSTPAVVEKYHKKI